MRSDRVRRNGDSPTQRRSGARVRVLQDIVVLYEGRQEQIVVKPPDLSTRGIFISTNQSFPEGAVLSLRFRLAHSRIEIQTRGEVRYCLPGVGVGVEFVGLSPQAERDITKEIDREIEAEGWRRTSFKPKPQKARVVKRRVRARA